MVLRMVVASRVSRCRSEPVLPGKRYPDPDRSAGNPRGSPRVGGMRPRRLRRLDGLNVFITGAAQRHRPGHGGGGRGRRWPAVPHRRPGRPAGRRRPRRSGTAAARWCVAEPVDLTDHDGVRRLARQVTDEHGAMDVVMNIAGISAWGTVQSLEHETWRRQVEVNLMGPIHVIEELVPPMVEAGRGGHLVNVSSAAGIIGMPWHAAYSASKFGLRGVSEVLRFDLGPARHRRLAGLPGRGAHPADRHRPDRRRRHHQPAVPQGAGPLPRARGVARDGGRGDPQGRTTQPLLGLHLPRHPADPRGAAVLPAGVLRSRCGCSTAAPTGSSPRSAAPAGQTHERPAHLPRRPARARAADLGVHPARRTGDPHRPAAHLHHPRPPPRPVLGLAALRRQADARRQAAPDRHRAGDPARGSGSRQRLRVQPPRTARSTGRAGRRRHRAGPAGVRRRRLERPAVAAAARHRVAARARATSTTRSGRSCAPPRTSAPASSC